jgi:hypothetical protein
MPIADQERAQRAPLRCVGDMDAQALALTHRTWSAGSQEPEKSTTSSLANTPTRGHQQLTPSSVRCGPLVSAGPGGWSNTAPEHGQPGRHTHTRAGKPHLKHALHAAGP